jgi:AraC-like DNA-binding protein
VELGQSLVRDLVAGASDRVPGCGPAIRGTARMRECLHEEGFDVDLETLARTAGLSKFHALRAFKRRYGLPPHQYQMCLRIAAVRQMLLEGAPQAEIAAHCGFVDQSHMIRQFKRSVGVTPSRYLKSETHAQQALARQVQQLVGALARVADPRNGAPPRAAASAERGSK